jgi:hypothetical protein
MTIMISYWGMRVSSKEPHASGNRHDVPGVALYLVLEVVAVDERRVLAHNLHYEEAPKQSHRWPHPHEHLVEVDEDGHQCDGVGRKVLQLEPVILQQREEEGGQRRHQPSQGIRCKENEVFWPHVGQRRDPMLQPGLETRRLPPHQPLQAGKGARHPEP